MGNTAKTIMAATAFLAVSSAPLLSQGQEGRQGPRGQGANLNQIAILLEKGEELNLTEQQVERLHVVKQNLDEANGPHVNELRTLRGDGDRPDASARERMRPLLEAIQQNQDSATEATMAILTEDQRGPAREIIESARPQRGRGRRGQGRPRGNP